jgi:uncharacterized protein YegL
VQILLAFLVGRPAAAQYIFREIMDASPDTEILTVLARTAEMHNAEQPDCVYLSTQLASIVENTTVLTSIREYQLWCPNLARHSFHTRALAAKESPPGHDNAPRSKDHGKRRHESTSLAPGGPVMPFYLICDASGSLHGEIAPLRGNLERLRRAIVSGPVVDDVAQFCIISFSDVAKVLTPMGQMSGIPALTAVGGANYGGAFSLLAQCIERDSRNLKAQGYKVYRPCAFFFTASEPSDSDWHDAFINTLTYDHKTGLGMKKYPIFVPFGFRGVPESVLGKLAYPPERGRWYHENNASVEEAVRDISGMIMKTVITSDNNSAYDPDWVDDPDDNSAYDPDWVDDPDDS